MIKVYRSAIISASADKVWTLVRDFNGLPKWHPAWIAWRAGAMELLK